MRRTVRGLLDRKGTEIWAVHPDSTVLAALQVMAEHNVGAVLVLESDRMAGILSERDYARKVILQRRSSADTKVAEIMTRDVQTVGLDDDLERCMELMTSGRFRHLPVLHEGDLVGLISIGDVVKSIIEAQASLIGDLERYIQG